MAAEEATEAVADTVVAAADMVVVAGLTVAAVMVVGVVVVVVVAEVDMAAVDMAVVVEVMGVVEDMAAEMVSSESERSLHLFIYVFAAHFPSFLFPYLTSFPLFSFLPFLPSFFCFPPFLTSPF